MNRRRVEWVREFLVTQMNHWVILFVVITMMRLFDKENPRIFMWAVLGLVPFLLCVVRRKVKSYQLFYFLHFLVPCTAIALPLQDSVIKGLLVVMMLAYGALSVRYKLYKPEGFEELIPPVVACGIGFGTFFLYNYQSGADWDNYYVLAVLIYLGCYFVYYFLDQYLRFLEFNKSSAANIPERAMLYSGMVQIGVFTFGAVMVLLLFSNLHWLEFLLINFKKGIVTVMRFLFGGYTPEEKEIELTITEKVSGGGFALEPGETALIWKILEYIALAVFAVALVVGIIVAVLKGIAYLKANFKATTAKDVKLSDDSLMDIRESCSIERSKKVERKLFGFLDSKERIRKIFKKRVLQEFDSQEQKGDYAHLISRTAGECCRPMQAFALQELYEKARYSSEVCTSEDVKAAKMAAKVAK